MHIDTLGMFKGSTVKVDQSIELFSTTNTKGYDVLNLCILQPGMIIDLIKSDLNNIHLIVITIAIIIYIVNIIINITNTFLLLLL